MLLRAISEGKITRIGESESRDIDVRLVEATNRDLRKMVREGGFREDLYFRLCHLNLSIPPLRERGGDWKIIAGRYLKTLSQQNQVSKSLSDRAIEVLEDYSWPGNVRELQGILDAGFCMSEGKTIEPQHFEFRLCENGELRGHAPNEGETEVESRYRRMAQGGETFWDVIRDPYLNRELNREQVRAVIRQGLKETEGSYKPLLPILGILEDNYLKFMDFLRHHDLKPEDA
jgi:DNA-binding NtrC family response regulator